MNKKLLSLLMSLMWFHGLSQSLIISTKDESSKNYLANSTVKLNIDNLTQTADNNGITIFQSLKPGFYDAEISNIGYSKTLIKQIKIEPGKTVNIEVFLKVNPNNLDEIIVKGQSNNPNGAVNGIKSIELEEIMRFSATFFDPARLAFNLAGVANTNDQANNMVIRGNAPEFMQWRIEGVEIVNPNHLSNAGTLNDQSTATGGGTNILSAQMLGNMNLHTGAFTPEYGNVVGGVMDMYFRNGNTEKRHHTVQVGVIGIDLATEGPMGKNKKASYLFNYRYSFTGLLGLMGVDFGGESIKFQDISGNLNFPTQKLGTFNVFFMGGNSSNEFKAPENADEIKTAKDLSNIDFYSRMGLIGIKHQININQNWKLNTVITESGLENLRADYRKNPFNVNSYKYQAKNIIGFSSSLSGNLKQKFDVKSGVNINIYFNEFNSTNSESAFYSGDETVIQPFAKISNHNLQKFKYSLGLNIPVYVNRKISYVEPRLGVSYLLNSKVNLTASAGVHSQVVNQPETVNFPALPIRAQHINIGSVINLSKDLEFTTELFVQRLYNMPDFGKGLYLSPLNGYTLNFFNATYPQRKTGGLNYGIENTLKKYMSNGFFGLLNLTFYRSKFSPNDNQFYSARYDGKFTSNITLGKEWTKNNKRTIGVNTHITYLGGFNEYDINLKSSRSFKNTIYNVDTPLINRNPNYFRPDIRIYLKKYKKSKTNTLSLDIQNVSGTQNKAYEYYDFQLDKVITKYQLGLLPLINYRIDF